MELIKKIPILFNTDMVRAIFNGKTQTRRVILPQPDIEDGLTLKVSGSMVYAFGGVNPFIIEINGKHIKPTYQKGNLMWVRETYHIKGGLPVMKELLKTDFKDKEDYLIYKADLPESDWKNYKWSPSIFMRKNACRLWLRVVGVRVERLQDITEDDAIKEGIKPKKNKILFANFKQIWKDDKLASERAYSYMSRDAFIDIWDSIYEKTYYTWRHNPWVCVIEFERI